MIVAIAVVAIAVVAGIAAGLMVAMPSAPDLDDPHLDERRVAAWIARHPVVRRLAGLLPRRIGPAIAETLVLAALAIVGAAATAGVVLIMVRTGTGLAAADQPVAEWAADRATDTSTTMMRELSRFGGTAYVLLGTVLVVVLGWRRDRRWTLPVFVAVAMIGQFLVSNSIKWSVDRARPAIENLTGFAGSSFPSGHAVAAAAAWATAAFVLGRGRARWVRGALTGLATALAVGVAGTRVALGVHWTTDVIVGLAVGWAWFAVCAVVFGGRRLAPVPAEVFDASV